MSRYPARLVDRWHDRVEPYPGQGILYWQVLTGRDPRVRAAVRDAQERLLAFPGLHLTPLRWLHATVLTLGSTYDISLDEAYDMLGAASESLAGTSPVQVAMERIAYSPEEILLELEPADLGPIREATQAAARKVLGREARAEVPWTPHTAIAYSTADQPAAPVIDALGHRLTRCDFTVDAVSLIIQFGPERDWDCRHLGSALLLG